MKSWMRMMIVGKDRGFVMIVAKREVRFARSVKSYEAEWGLTVTCQVDEGVRGATRMVLDRFRQKIRAEISDAPTIEPYLSDNPIRSRDIEISGKVFLPCLCRFWMIRVGVMSGTL